MRSPGSRLQGTLGINTIFAVAVPEPMIMTGVRATDNLVYDAPRGDLVVLLRISLRSSIYRRTKRLHSLTIRQSR